MAYEFFVLMTKRKDGQVYADLHKTNGLIYLDEEAADRALAGRGKEAEHYGKVKMVALTQDEYDELVSACNSSANGSKA